MNKPLEAFQNSSLILVDANTLRRDFLRRMALELGFGQARIFEAVTAEDALALALQNEIPIIVADDSIGYVSISRLHAYIEERQVRDPHSLLFCVCELASQGIVGRLAEEGVEEFIFRPFSKEKFKEIFLSSFAQRQNPSGDLKWLQKGRVHMAEGQFIEAKHAFEMGLGESETRGATFCYYLAQVALMEEKFDEAAIHFEAGLAMNRIHFRCLQGMFDVRMRQNRVEDAYQALRHVVDAYPENPERFALLVKMSVAGAHYRDIERMNDAFEVMLLKNAALRKHLAAGHAILGRSLCVQRNRDAALKALTRAIELSNQGKSVVEYAIESLEKYEYKSDAEIFRGKYASAKSVQKSAA